MDPFQAGMLQTIERHALLTPGRTVVVGVSGGPDSMALLHALVELRSAWNLQLTVAHLDHGLRGAESTADAAYVAEMCAGLHVELRSELANVAELRRRLHLSTEHAARTARHALLRRVAADVGADRIALGHTADDRVETVLMNIIRGSGIEGLAALPSARFPIVRPLIGQRRADTVAYCERFALNPRIDSSNAELDYRRNRIRAELLPHLASYYNESVDQAILRLADLASADNDFLESLAAESMERAVVHRSKDEVLLDAARLAGMHIALRRRVVRAAIVALRGSAENLGLSPVDQILEASAGDVRLSLDLPGAESARTVRASVEPGVVRVSVVSSPTVPESWRVPLVAPGVTPLEAAGVAIEILCEADGTHLEQAVRGRDLEHGAWGPCIFRADDVKLPLVARSWRAGDRMRPFGLGGSRKLQDLFTDRKITADRRPMYPVIVDDGGAGRVLMVVGIHTDERAILPAHLDMHVAESLIVILARRSGP